MFAGTGRFSSRVYMRMFLPGTISPVTICKVSIISSLQSGTECLYDKCPSRLSEPDPVLPVPDDKYSFHINECDKYERYTCMARSC